MFFILLFPDHIKYVVFVFTGGLFSSTAGPLLPDNMAFKPLNKIWKSSSTESFQDITSSNTTDGFDTSKSFLKRKYSLKAFQQGFKLHLSPSANLNMNEDSKEILIKDVEKINGIDDRYSNTRFCFLTNFTVSRRFCGLCLWTQ